MMTGRPLGIAELVSFRFKDLISLESLLFIENNLTYVFVLSTVTTIFFLYFKKVCVRTHVCVVVFRPEVNVDGKGLFLFLFFFSFF